MWQANHIRTDSCCAKTQCYNKKHFNMLSATSYKTTSLNKTNIHPFREPSIFFIHTTIRVFIHFMNSFKCLYSHLNPVQLIHRRKTLIKHENLHLRQALNTRISYSVTENILKFITKALQQMTGATKIFGGIFVTGELLKSV